THVFPIGGGICVERSTFVRPHDEPPVVHGNTRRRRRADVFPASYSHSEDVSAHLRRQSRVEDILADFAGLLRSFIGRRIWTGIEYNRVGYRHMDVAPDGEQLVCIREWRISGI